MIKKYFNEELVMTKQDDENFETFTKCWICDNGFVKGDVKLRYQWHVTRKFWGAAKRDCTI